MNRYIWSAVGVVALAYVLMAFVLEFLPVFFVIVAVVCIYKFIFKRPW